MTRPVPLFTAPELVRFLQPHPLTDEIGAHGDYLNAHLSGDVFIIGRDPERLSRLATFAREVDGVSSVETCLNATGICRQINEHDLGIGDRMFDTIVYTKEVTSWFGRSPDFQRLTPHLKQGGTMLVKSKWLPDSNRLTLDEIAVAGAFDFDFPHVYLRFTKFRTHKTLDTFGSAAVADGGVVKAVRGGFADRNLAEQTKAFVSQFPEDARATDYSPGWSWHSRLKEFVQERLDHVDGPVGNLCCGTNELGDVRVDQLATWEDRDGETHPTAATQIGDATNLEIDDNALAGGLTDPPWKVDPETRVRLFSEAVRVVEPGGMILMNAWWIPHHPYATLTEVRPVIANVLDDSLSGPGGLSFLSTYEVQDQPDFGENSYTLAGHMETSGRAALSAYRHWKHAPPAVDPTLDPRFVDDPNYACSECGYSRLRPASTNSHTVYECSSCGFRNRPYELVENGHG